MRDADSQAVEEADVVVLGGGLAGLAVGAALGDAAVVLERESRPGGLVRTERIGDYWFDHVIHLLYFDDPALEAQVRDWLGDVLAPCVPVAWVETTAGTARFPLQNHLAGLDPTTVAKILAELRQLQDAPDTPPAHYQALLERTFGRTLCDLFFLPYNRKMWKRPLDTLAPAGFQWNMARPSLADVERGARNSASTPAAYNARGWYPQPARDAPVRGMEVLSRALAARVPRLHVQHAVETIDGAMQIVTVRVGDERRHFHWRRACVSTLPLPVTVRACYGAPEPLRHACEGLPRNQVLSAALCVRGRRPENVGHWRYYPDPDFVFTRLVFLHAFDPHNAPENGWPLLAEIPLPAEEPTPDPAALLARVESDVRRVGLLPEGSSIVAARIIANDPAYVVFRTGDQGVGADARAFLRSQGIEPLGRYGRWEYSSMAQVLQDGFRWAEQHARLPAWRSHASFSED